MTNNEILKASLLDIIFENRNKSYGAYALRNDYDKRLMKALGIGLGAVLIVILFNFLKLNTGNSTGNNRENGGHTLTVLEIHEPEKKEPEPEPKKDQPKPGQVKSTPPVIVPDILVKENLADKKDLQDGIISTVTTSGTPGTGPDTTNLKPDKGGDGGTITKAVVQPEIKIYYREPQYPGGIDALIEFMRSNLITPEELEIGEKKIVKVKFVVGTDGNLSDVTVLESPGRAYEKEVVRVVKRMKKWEPAIQNDIPVSVSYVLPITFITVE